MAENSVAPWNNIIIRAPLASEQEKGQDEARDNPADAIPYDQLFLPALLYHRHSSDDDNTDILGECHMTSQLVNGSR